ncbi:hypothetical protein PtA15_4A392 [Puccinia triticina]|uniref:Dynein heavy chain tail domain-containing protein n=1 Tax=Puccinia triticina TaxID=208348 RepID=A0ABY7CJ08_9BASI|nr:uncharacterized protein PtA15_4A392 [Puccinia triticina]WAQ83942.1 hypothetical protein PtA15_4A392 [Puccinia triticina]
MSSKSPQEIEKELNVARGMVESLKIDAGRPTPPAPGWKQLADARILFIKALKDAISLLENGPEGQAWQELLLRLGAQSHEYRVERTLVPRLRQHLVEVSDIFVPDRLYEVLSSKNPVKQTDLIKLVANEMNRLKSSVTAPWSSSQGSENLTYPLDPWYFPDVPWDVDQIRDEIIKTFRVYIKTLKSKEPPAGELRQPSICEMLDSVDRLHGDFENPCKVLKAKWKYVTREIEIMHMTVGNCLKPRAACKDTNPKGRDDDGNVHPWPSLEDMSKADIKIFQAYIPLLKVCRLLLVKLCKNPSSEPLLIHKMSMSKLKDFYAHTEELEEDLRKYTTMILERLTTRALGQLDAFLKFFNYIIKTIESHLATLTSPDDRAHVEKSRQWCLMWKTQYRFAIRNFSPKHKTIAL